MNKQLELNLPYLEIVEVANRKYLRENFKQTGRASYYIEFSKIKVRENFNKRIVFEDIPELSESIFVHGLKDPIVLDILPDGTAYIEAGHRRHKAIQLLISNKREGWTAETPIEFFSNKNDVTELDRMVNQYTSNNHKKKLKPFEAAAVAHDVKFNYSEKPKSNEEVAELMGVSRQQADNYILISSADDLLKNEMLTADMNLTECVALVRNEKRSKKQSDKKEEDSHKNSSAATSLPKDELAGEIKELDELEKQAEEVRMTNNLNPGEFESKELNLVGNTIAETGKEKSEDDGTVKYDESRDEVKQIQNCIKLADKLEAIVTKLDVPDGSKKDVSDIVKWLQYDLAEVRTWIHKNKKQNKAR